jgi:PIF1-like helicase/Helix-turn-helix domain/Helicase
MNSSATQTTPEAEYVLKLINQTHQNIFLTGKAGTGKTTLLREIVSTTHKNCVVVAPTGIAAINAGGVTIHSMFQLPFNPFIPTDYFDYSQLHFDTIRTINRHFKVRADKRNLVNNIELLIVDEVSMLRPDILDAMNQFLQYVRFNRKPFGGVQVLFIGDLQQLPPIIKNDEWDLLSQFYNGKFFFHAHVLRDEQPLYIELSKIFRQSDQEFIDILNRLRHNQVDEDIISKLSDYVEYDFDIKYNPGYIVLTTHNQMADTMNADALKVIRNNEVVFTASIVDDFPANLYPIEKDLKLKEGAQVMFIKNDTSFEKRYYNGKIGVIESLEEDEIVVRFLDDNREIKVDKHEWENKKFKLNVLTNEIEEELLGTFSQYPLKLAWAITIHKSQGLTFEKAAIDIANIFAPGQAYVALSRLTSLKGLKLLSPLGNRKLATEADVLDYETNKTDTETLELNISNYTKDYLHEILRSTFDFAYSIRLIDRLQKELFESGEGSTLYKSKAWIEQLIDNIKQWQEVAQKFQAELQQSFGQVNLDLKHIHERTEKAYGYYYERIVTNEKAILTKIAEVSVEKGTKEFEASLHEIENSVFSSLKQMMKAKRIIHNVIHGITLTKSNCDTTEIERIKSKIIAEIRENNTYSLNTFLEPSGRGLNKKDKNAKSKEEKKSTFEVTMELWKQSKTVEQIAEERKLTTGTIFGHLAKFVEKGELDITDVIPLDKLQLIDKKLPKTVDKKVLNDMRSALNNEYSFDELRLYRAWKGD